MLSWPEKTMEKMKEEHYRKLERMYLASNINTMVYQKTTIAVGKGTAEISFALSEKFHHALGAMHGSVYFKLLDDACFFAVNSLVDDVFVLTTSFELALKRPQALGTITANGIVTETGSNRFHASGILKNSEGKELAKGSGSFVRSKQMLTPEIGYK